jgi:hypothetical protein
MSTGTLMRKLARIATRVELRNAPPSPLLDELRADHAQLMVRAGMPPDDWQRQLLRSNAARVLLLCSRQSGKSTVAAALALRAALLGSNAPVLLLSPSLRQSGELFRKILDIFNALGRPVAVAAESALRLELTNGSRIVSLPGDEKNIRGFSGVSLLIIDEAARVNDALYCSVRPMLAVSQGRLVALSTPFGKRGWFHDEWHGFGPWERVRITAEQCKRIPRSFLEEERKALGDRWFKQEYLCDFSESVDCVFSYESIQAAFVNDLEPWSL